MSDDELLKAICIHQRTHIFHNGTGQPGALASLGTPLHLLWLQGNGFFNRIAGQPPGKAMNADDVLQCTATVCLVTFRHHAERSIQHL